MFLRSRLAAVAAEVRAPLRESEVIACSSAPFYLAPGHPWHNVPCLICAQPPGETAIYCTAILGASVHSASYHRPGAQAYLIHVAHGQLEPLELWLAAHKRERPGCPCHSRSPLEAASYPYHQL